MKALVDQMARRWFRRQAEKQPVRRPALITSRYDRDAAELDAIWRAEPNRFFAPLNITPDPWQRSVFLSDAPRQLLLCTRQGGKSTAAGARAVRVALTVPRSLILVLSPTQRQAGEFFKDKVKPFYNALGRPVRAVNETTSSLDLANGSRLIALPDNEAGIRGFSGARLIVVDEASRVSDDLYRAVLPMLAISGGALLALSTPYGKRGWFFEEWDKGETWDRVMVTADECPRISPAFLLEQQARMGARWFRQEFYCSFEDAIDAVFMQSDIDAMFAGGAQVEPLW